MLFPYTLKRGILIPLRELFMTGREIKYLILILISYIVACIETDIFLPALPDMMLFL